MPTRRRSCPSFSASSEVPPIVRLWLLRVLVPLGGQREFVGSNGFSNEALAGAVGLGHWIDASEEFEFDPRAVRVELRRLYQVAERELQGAEVPARLSTNIARLSALIGLSATDRSILAYSVLTRTESLLGDAAELLGQVSSNRLFRILSVLLDCPEPEIRTTLGSHGALARSGLVYVDRGASYSLGGKLELLSEGFADQIASIDADPVELLRDTVVVGSSAELALDDYEHIAPVMSVLLPYLTHAVATGRKGVNVFLHGVPGTGKSQLAKVLAQALDRELFEISSEDGQGDAVSGGQRLRAFRAAQHCFASREAMIVFDEAEDIFNDSNGIFDRLSTAQTHKAWINRALEENPVPTLWLSNSVSHLDRAFVRRFDMVFELPVPPRKQRERIIQAACNDLLDAASVARIAESDALTPAVVARAASVVRPIRDVLGAVGAAAAVELLIGNTLEAQGLARIRRDDPNRLPELYDPGFINADTDLARLAAGLCRSRSGRLCLYGPPGTGKTAYGRWLADHLGVPLLVKRASDLLSMWVGENEHNIARAFRQAETEGALLLIDEVDSFLQDRRGGRKSWEVTLVNEMLTQMESYAGVFVASTNLMEGLDQAALRRFDLKVKFDFLMPDQACALFRRHCQHLELPAPAPEDLAQLKQLRRLTPGDFAAVIRRHRFAPIVSAVALVGALEAECAVKEGAKGTIGFFQ